MKNYCLLWIALFGCSSGETTTANPGSTHNQTDAGADANLGSAGGTGIDTGGTKPIVPKCGDEVCSSTETCEACPIDCGQCPKCDLAPTCTGAVALPAEGSVTPRRDLSSFTKNDQAVAIPNSTPVEPPANTSCLDAKLRIRLSKLQAHGVGGNGLGARHLYCVISASDGYTSQITVTSPTKDMKDGDSFEWDPSAAIVWGGKLGEKSSALGDELRATRNNLTITYNCFRTNNTEGAAKVAATVADSAREAGAVGGSYGWAFGVGSVAADLISGALDAAKGDTHVLNETKTIEAKQLLDLTNARTWSVREANDQLQPIWDRWDWELTMQAWGCADARPDKPR